MTSIYTALPVVGRPLAYTRNLVRRSSSSERATRRRDDAMWSAVSSHDLADAPFMTALSALTRSRSLLGLIAALPSK